MQLLNSTIMDRKLFNKALDALNEFMISQDAHIYDAPTMECSRNDDEYVYLSNRINSFGKYQIATGKFIPDSEE